MYIRRPRSDVRGWHFQAIRKSATLATIAGSYCNWHKMLQLAKDDVGMKSWCHCNGTTKRDGGTSSGTSCKLATLLLLQLVSGTAQICQIMLEK
jgi:hypothetical protein